MKQAYLPVFCYSLQIHASEMQSWIMHTNGSRANSSWTQPLSHPISVSTSCGAWNGPGLVSTGLPRQERPAGEGSTLTSPAGSFCLGACSGASLSSFSLVLTFDLVFAFRQVALFNLRIFGPLSN